MIFINTFELARKLKNNQITEDDGLYYLIGTTILSTIALIITIAGNRLTLSMGILISLASLLTILFVILGFKENKKGGGKNFFQCYICLQFTIIVNTLLLTIVTGLLIGIISALFPQIKDYMDISIFIQTLGISILTNILLLKGFKIISKN